MSGKVKENMMMHCFALLFWQKTVMAEVATCVAAYKCKCVVPYN